MRKVCSKALITRSLAFLGLLTGCSAQLGSLDNAASAAKSDTPPSTGPADDPPEVRFMNLPRDVNGFSEIMALDTAVNADKIQKIYISSSDPNAADGLGNECLGQANFADQPHPLKTLSGLTKVFKKLSSCGLSHKATWVFFRRGDIWDGNTEPLNTAGVSYIPSGIVTPDGIVIPVVFTSYYNENEKNDPIHGLQIEPAGPNNPNTPGGAGLTSEGATYPNVQFENRPLFKSKWTIFRFQGGHYEHLAFLGLQFEGSGGTALRWNGGGVPTTGVDLRIEDCYFGGFATNIDLSAADQHFGTAPGLRHVRIYRSVIVDAYKPDGNTGAFVGQGINASGVDDFIIEDSLFDHVGWKEAAGRNQYTHALYFEPSVTHVQLRSNFFTRMADGQQLRGGGVVIDNFIAQNAVALTMYVQNGIVQDNSIVEPVDTNRGSGVINVAGINVRTPVPVPADFHPKLTIQSNLFTRPLGSHPQTYAHPIDLLSGSGVTISENIFYDWIYDSKPSRSEAAVVTPLVSDWVFANNSVNGLTPANYLAPEPVGDVILNTTESYLGHYYSTLAVSGGDRSMLHFIWVARSLSKNHWLPGFTAHDANNYMRQNFGMKPTNPYTLNRQ